MNESILNEILYFYLENNKCDDNQKMLNEIIDLFEKLNKNIDKTYSESFEEIFEKMLRYNQKENEYCFKMGFNICMRIVIEMFSFT